MRIVARVLFLLCMFFWVLPVAPIAKANSELDVTITISVSPQSSFLSSITFHADKSFTKQVLRARSVQTAFHPHWIRASMTMHHRTYLYDHDGRLFDVELKTMLIIPDQVKHQIEQYVQIVEQAHFGNPLPWEQVKKSFQRMGFATVIDLETGQRFQVQRRAGSRHADVQPLTRNDTMIMKEIYQGKWSWKRRAILVEVDGKYFAASMHGMPHGAGAIPDNAFPGHFCIHFFGSSTHRRLEPDPSHSLMILKASGHLPQTLARAEPEELVGYFLTSLNEHDEHTLRMTTSGEATLPEALLYVQSIKRPKEITPAAAEGLSFVAISVPVDYVAQSGRDKSGHWLFLLHRRAPWERWQIVHVEME